MRRISSFFMNMKLRSKFLLSFTAIIFVTVLMISVVNYVVSIGAIKRNSGEFSEYLIGQIGINLEKRTKDIEEIAFQQFRSSSLSERLSQTDTSEETIYFRNKYINDFMSELMFTKEDFLAVMIIDVNEKPYLVQRQTFHQYDQELLQRLDIDAVQQKRGKPVWFQGEHGTVFMVRAMFDIPTAKYVGMIAIGLDSSYISSIITNVNQLMDGDILILNENNELFVPDLKHSGVAHFFLDNKLYLANESKNSLAYNGSQYISTVVSTLYDKWKIVQIIDVKQLTRDTDSIKYWTISTILVSLLIAFLMAVFISKNITENIRLLLQSMTSFSLDFNHHVIVPKSRDEVGLLAAKFNSMADKINDLFNSVYREKLLKQKAEYRTLQFEYKALQAQMNPHFLYNTLESVYSMAKIKGEEEIGEMIYLLGKLLRESIGKKGDVLTLQEEISFIQSYLSIHKMIYGDKIEVVYRLDDELMDCRVPKFILQPLVENAVIHGIEAKPGKGVIHIICRAEEEDLIIEVADNGIGMDEEMVERLLNPERYGTIIDSNKHTNVGIISVHKRAKILYGDKYGLSIQSKSGEGTTVQIRLPILDGGHSRD
ncbi:sensor histidine kinase [Paenibacillus spongiae]|uniref:histidine kinase n=1 Tax=Paenibacillus spongiae TaxID=2909671 RepID=A0ABY5SKN5_9BACL|nr:sensor histidine kinase [Paenibacillus spongiae]UVI32803.1 sensor histidine kinase [Paenibacillus spongiae]